MTVRDKLLRAAFEHGDPVAFVRTGRLAWLAEYAVELQIAADVEPLVEAAVAARTLDLEAELRAERRRSMLLEAQVAALEPLASPEVGTRILDLAA